MHIDLSNTNWESTPKTVNETHLCQWSYFLKTTRFHGHPPVFWLPENNNNSSNTLFQLGYLS
jgi:hypothetical protein